MFPSQGLLAHSDQCIRASLEIRIRKPAVQVTPQVVPLWFQAQRRCAPERLCHCDLKKIIEITVLSGMNPGWLHELCHGDFRTILASMSCATVIWGESLKSPLTMAQPMLVAWVVPQWFQEDHGIHELCHYDFRRILEIAAHNGTTHAGCMGCATVISGRSFHPWAVPVRVEGNLGNRSSQQHSPCWFQELCHGDFRKILASMSCATVISGASLKSWPITAQPMLVAGVVPRWFQEDPCLHDKQGSRSQPLVSNELLGSAHIYIYIYIHLALFPNRVVCRKMQHTFV